MFNNVLLDLIFCLTLVYVCLVIFCNLCDFIIRKLICRGRSLIMVHKNLVSPGFIRPKLF